MVRLHVDEVCPKDSIYPLIVNFLNGSPNENFGTNECLLFDNEKTGLKTIVTKIDGILYAGDEENSELSKTFIVRRNKTTGKVRILEAGTVNVKPVFNSNTTTESTSLETPSTKLDLSRKFGSKKSKKIMEQREKLKVNIESVTKQMKTATKEISQETIDLSIYNKTDSDDFYIPPIDRGADKASQVYDLNTILTDEQYDKILSELEGKKYSDDLLPLIKSIISNKSLSQKQTVLAVYANYLLNLYNTPARKMSVKSFCPCPHSVTLNDILLKNFTIISTSTLRARPTPYKDKALCYAIVFLLMINNLKFDLDSLCEIIKISPNTAAQKSRVTGASVVTVGNKKVVQLKLPLVSKSIARRKSAKF